MNLAPIVLFVYNRVEHTQRTLECLKKNNLANKSDLFIFSDAAKNNDVVNDVNKVREIINSIDGFKSVTIIEREENFGLANSIIDGVTQIINKFGKVIVLEDDLESSSFFLEFMNNSLNHYKYYEKVWSITGFSYPLNINDNYKYGTYLYSRSSSKSWATWKNKWNKIEFDENKIISRWSLEQIKDLTEEYGKDLYSMFLKQLDQKINSWSIRFTLNQILLKGFTVYPIVSYIKDIGDDSGTHANNSLSHNVTLNQTLISTYADYKDEYVTAEYKNYLKRYFFKVKIHAIKNKLKKLIRC